MLASRREKLRKNKPQNKLFLVFSLSLQYRFWTPVWCQLGLIFPPKIRKKYIKNGSPRRIDFGHEFWHRCWCDLGCILGPKLGPSWRLLAHKTPTKRTQDPPKVKKKRSWALRRPQDRLLVDCWSIVDRFLVDVWSMFDRFFVDSFIDF